MKQVCIKKMTKKSHSKIFFIYSKRNPLRSILIQIYVKSFMKAYPEYIIELYSELWKINFPQKIMQIIFIENKAQNRSVKKEINNLIK